MVIDMTMNNELCEKLANAAYEKSQELGIDISFAICDPDGLLRMYRRFDDALVLSIQLVPAKAYTSAITMSKTEDLAKAVVEGGDLYGINTVNPKITLVTGGFPLFDCDKLIGAIGIGGGSEDEDRQIGEYVVKVFKESI